MSLLGSIYATGAVARNFLYDRGLFPEMRLRGPVISIGNLTVGGSGKTPFTLLLGGLLRTRAIKYDVLSRGYGRQSRGVLQVDPEGNPEQFGDEPILLARKLEVPVVLGESRHNAGLFAEKQFGPQVHLLDDGFQHRSLARDFDIVLIVPGDENAGFLPGGRLRESFSSLKRADAVVTFSGALPEIVSRLEKPVWSVKRDIAVANPPQSSLAFCGIARPDIFFSELRAAGVQIAGTARFRDHHRYTRADVADLKNLKAKYGASGFITTEKDLINLGPYRSELEPLAVAEVTMELQDSARLVDAMLSTISTRRPGMRKSF